MKTMGSTRSLLVSSALTRPAGLRRQPDPRNLPTCLKQPILQIYVVDTRIRLPRSHVIEILAGHPCAGVIADGEPHLGSMPLVEIVGRAWAAHASGHPSGLQRVREDAGPEAGDGEGQ